MKVLVVLPHAGYTRNFEWVLELLARRGHSVDVVIEGRGDGRDLESFTSMISGVPRIRLRSAPARPRGGTRSVAVGLRLLRDYLRYLDQPYASAERPRRRIEAMAPGAGWLGPRLRARPRLRRLVSKVLGIAESQATISPGVVALLRDERPDVLVVTPLVEPGSDQVEYIRAGRALGIPTVLPVASWDNLTIKGGIHEVPDLVTVWNESQRLEAVELHAVPADRVRITGAVAYDHWFGSPAVTSRDVFCRTVGLDADRPFVVYAGSSRFIAPGEGVFVLEWARAVRAQLKDLQILVRPHPSNALGLSADDLAQLIGVVCPNEGVNPISRDARRHYQDSVHHSAAVVGINTSAFVEAAVAGRPALAVLDERFAGTQRGVLHFDHLLPERGGAVYVAVDLYDSVDVLRRVLTGVDQLCWASANRTFVKTFVRPCGLDAPASTVLVDCMEELTVRGAAGAPASRGARLAGRAIVLAGVPIVRMRQLRRSRATPRTS